MLVVTAALIFFSFAGSAFCAVNGALIHSIRTGSHGSYDRLVFDIEGERPSRVGPPSDEEITIEFKSVSTGAKPEKLMPRLPSSIARLTFEQTEQSFLVKITFGAPNTSVKTFFTNWRKGCYRLVLDFSTQSAPSPQTQPISDAEAFSKGKAEKKNKRRALTQPDHFSSPLPALDKVPQQPSSGNAKVDELYETADDAFNDGQEDLANKGFEIIGLYTNAIKAGPKAPQVPQALYRSSLCYVALDDARKAEEGFKRIIADFPTHPLVPQCWLNLAKVLQKKRSYIGSVQAFRTALGYPLDKEHVTEAYYSLGKALTSADAHKEAIEAMKKCLDEDPTFYRKNPDMLKSLGESFFAIQQYGKSCESFFRYLNLQKNIPDRDVILAKVAEGLLYMGEHDLANSIYTYIERNHPDSEGDVIGKIRKAEILEQKDGKHKEQALAIYEELARKTLSPPLSKLVLFRLANYEWKNGHYSKSRSLIDEALQIKGGTTSNDEFLNLRGKVVVDWIKQAYAGKNYPEVIQLYQDNKSQFQFWGSPEFDIMAAESYGSLKLYPNALEIYRQIMSKGGKKNDEWLFKAAHYAFLMRDMEKATQLALQIQSETFDRQKAEMLGQIYFEQKKYKEAVQYFGKIFQSDKVFGQFNSDHLLSFVESLIQLGRFEDAAGVLQKASPGLENEDVEKRIRACLLQSKCYQSLKQPDKAIEVLERLLPVLPSDEVRDQMNYQLSVLYSEAGQETKATEKLTQLLQSSQPLWKAAAQQQLDYLQMQNSKPKSTEQ
jgi:tetratricopeptide (TPR) repeat protein